MYGDKVGGCKEIALARDVADKIKPPREWQKRDSQQTEGRRKPSKRVFKPRRMDSHVEKMAYQPTEKCQHIKI